MADIPKTKIQTSAITVLDGQWASLTPATLTSADVLTGWEEGRGQILWLFNATGGTLNILIQGAGVPTGINIEGFGNRVLFDDGVTVTLTAGQTKVIPMDTIPLYFRGATAINITGGTGARIAFLEPVKSGVTKPNG